jgi:hypothetical protein
MELALIFGDAIPQAPSFMMESISLFEHRFSANIMVSANPV